MFNTIFSGESSRHGDEFLMSALAEMIFVVDDAAAEGMKSLVGEFTAAVDTDHDRIALQNQAPVEVSAQPQAVVAAEPVPVAFQPAQPEATVYDFDQAQRIKAAREITAAVHHSPEIEGLREIA